MSPTRRIILNILATYGRSLFALVLGLFSGRWLLMSLGAVDYGLYGVVGGLTSFISIFNSLLGGAIGRFYALAIGQARKNSSLGKGLENCRGWFSIAVAIHIFVPCVLMIVGYPAGEWLVRNWLTIPIGRVENCVWVWRFVCISCFAGMANVPFGAMYVAKQYIAELTIYSVVQTLCNFIFVWFMVTHPQDWLVKYAAMACAIAVVPQIVICLRACAIFPECRIVPSMCMNFARLRELFAYCLWQSFGTFSGMVRGQGISILVNKYFGPQLNASMSLANTVSHHSASLIAAMQGAFAPAIVVAFGAGDIKQVHVLSYRACKFGLLLALIFVLPLSMELPEVLRLWLNNPPPYTTGLCWCMLFMLLADKSTLGHMIAVNASGKIALYQTLLGGILILALPLAWLGVALGAGVYIVAEVLCLTMIVCSAGRAVMARSRVGLSVKYWLRNVLLPVSFVSFVAVVVGGVPILLMQPSFFRLVLTTICSEVVLLLMSWHFVLSDSEQSFVREHVHVFVCRIRDAHG